MRAALGRIILTPPDSIGGYIGRYMAGFTPVPKCMGKYDDIYGYALLLEETVLGNIQKRMIIISLDYCQVPLLFTEYIKEKIQEAYKIHPNQILIHATHTHKSFDMVGLFSYGGFTYLGIAKGIFRGAYERQNDVYKIWVAKQLVKLVGDLINKLQPAQIGWKQEIINKPIARNRVTGLRSDQPMNVITLKSLQTGKIFGIICNYGVHPTTIGGRNTNLSAEYPGRVVTKIHELSNKEIECIFFTGPAGNTGPLFHGIAEEFTEPFYHKDKNGRMVRKQHYEFTKTLGKILGNEAFRIANSITDEEYFDIVEFKSFIKKFWVPMIDYNKHWVDAKKKLTNWFVHWVKRYILIPIALVLGDVQKPNFPGFALKHKHGKINVYTQIQYMTIKGIRSKEKTSREFSILGVPGELFDDYAKRIYETSLTSPTDTFIFQASNDWIAYLFPIGYYISHGGYEPLASFAPLCGAYVFVNYLKLLEEIKNQISAGFY